MKSWSDPDGPSPVAAAAPAPAGAFDPLGLPFPDLAERVEALGGRGLHARRWFQALHREGRTDPSAAFELGRGLTERLRAAARPAQAVPESEQCDPDGTRKLRLRLADGAQVECVLIPERARLTLCLSSQAGCAVGCRFCATARLGLSRNLRAGEIVAQVHAARRAAGRTPTHLVFMGMGEPLHNWPAVRDAIAILSDPGGLRLAKRRMTVSTSGVLPRMAEVVRVRVPLALSLHATSDAERRRLIPSARTPLRDLIAEARRLVVSEGGVLMIQYLLLAGVNDSPRHAAVLVAWLRDFPCHVNLLEFNEAPGLPFRRTAPAAAQAFLATLREAGLRAVLRRSRGLEIDGACGQLALEGRPKGRP